MAEYTEEQVRGAVDRIKAAFGDGFDFADIAVLVKEIMAFAKGFEGLTGGEKKALALRVANTVMVETDIPYLPDKLNLPFLGEVGADAMIMRAVDKIIDLVWDADQGKLGLGTTAEDAPSD